MTETSDPRDRAFSDCVVEIRQEHVFEVPKTSLLAGDEKFVDEVLTARLRFYSDEPPSIELYSACWDMKEPGYIDSEIIFPTKEMAILCCFAILEHYGHEITSALLESEGDKIQVKAVEDEPRD